MQEESSASLISEKSNLPAENAGAAAPKQVTSALTFLRVHARVHLALVQ